MASAPSSSTIALEAFTHNISAAFEMPIESLVDTVPACDAQVYNSYKLFWIAPNTSFSYYSNCCRASEVTSRTMSPMSCKSPSVRVIGFSDVLVAFDFFLDPLFSCSLGHLMWTDVSCGSTPCCFVCLSISSSISGEGDLTSLSEPRSVPPIFFYAC